MSCALALLREMETFSVVICSLVLIMLRSGASRGLILLVARYSSEKDIKYSFDVWFATRMRATRKIGSVALPFPFPRQMLEIDRQNRQKTIGILLAIKR